MVIVPPWPACRSQSWEIEKWMLSLYYWCCTLQAAAIFFFILFYFLWWWILSSKYSVLCKGSVSFRWLLLTLSHGFEGKRHRKAFWAFCKQPKLIYPKSTFYSTWWSLTKPPSLSCMLESVLGLVFAFGKLGWRLLLCFNIFHLSEADGSEAHKENRCPFLQQN